MIDNTAAAIWNTALGQLQIKVTPCNYDTWLRETVGVRCEPGGFVVGTPNEVTREWLSVQLRKLITQIVAQVLGEPAEVSFEVVRVHDDGAPPLLCVDAPAAGDSRRQPAIRPALNPCLTFDEFVVGEENRLAYEAAWRVAHEPSSLNPLVIFGPSGLGKTHLLNAIGHTAWERGLSVILAPAERFGNDYARSAGTGAFDQFRNRYRRADMLLVDDLQFFEGKEKFQKEFFHTFNDLYAEGKQIVVTADRAPSGLLGIMDGLRSRLQCGLTADIERPRYDTRLAILGRKAKRHRVALNDDALRRIATRHCPSVRELEGYLNRVVAYAPLVGGEVTQQMIDKALSPLSPSPLSTEAPPPDPEAIVDAVCRRTGATPADLRGRSRARDVTYARHLAMYVLKHDGRCGPADIGRVFGDRDHSTVLGAITRIANELRTRPETGSDVAAVRASLASQLHEQAV